MYICNSIPGRDLAPYLRTMSAQSFAEFLWNYSTTIMLVNQNLTIVYNVLCTYVPLYIGTYIWTDHGCVACDRPRWMQVDRPVRGRGDHSDGATRRQERLGSKITRESRISWKSWSELQYTSTYIAIDDQPYLLSTNVLCRRHSVYHFGDLA